MPEDEPDHSDEGHAGYGIGSAVVGVIAIAAIVLAALIWTQHRADADELRYRARAMQAAAEWTSVLINMNKDTVEASLAQLHEGTVGQLNADFDASVKPYRELVQKLQSRTTGQVDSVAVEYVHHEQPGQDRPQPTAPELSVFASRTDTVMVVATSVSENAGSDKPQTVRWTLRLDVADIDGKPMISRLEPIR
jgi:FtsZ-interacting cell division protein ZipA